MMSRNLPVSGPEEIANDPAFVEESLILGLERKWRGQSFAARVR